MNKAVPWSIKGVDFDAREAAKEAARRDGVTLGEWMNRAISTRAAEIGADAREFDADERLEAVAAQLARLSREADEEATPQRRRGEPGRRPEPRQETRQEIRQEPKRERERFAAARCDDADWDEEVAPERASRRRPQASAQKHPQEYAQDGFRERPRAKAAPRDAYEADSFDEPRRIRPARESFDPEALLEQAVSAFQDQAGRAEARTARAIANVATMIETAEHERSDALAQVDARIADLEQKLHRGATDSVKPLRGMIASVHDRLADIETQLQKKERSTDYQPLRSALGRLETRIDAMSRQAEEPADETVYRQLDNRLADIVARIEKAETTPPGADRDEQFLRLERRVDAMMERMDRQNARSAPASAAAPQRRALDGAISEIAARQRDLESGAKPVRTPAPPLAALIDQRFEALSRKLDRAAERHVAQPREDARIDRLQNGIESLSGRLEDMRRELSVVHAAPRAAAPSNAGLEKALRDLTARVESALSAPSIAGPADLDKLHSELAAMGRALTDVAPRGAVAGLESAMRDLANRVDSARDAMLRAAEMTARAEASLAANATRPDEFASLRGEIAAMGRSLGDVAPRGAVVGLESAMRDLGNRVESARDAMMCAAEERGQPTSTAEIEALARQVAAMGRALEDVAPRSQMASLEQAIGALGDRIERSRLDGLREAVLAPIENLADELRRAMAEAGTSANFDGVAKQLRDVEARLEELRHAGSADRSDFLKVRDESDELRAMIASAVEQMAPMERIERQVSSLSDRLEEVARQAGDAGRAQEAGLAAGMAQSAANWRGVETRLDDIATRIDRVATVRNETPQADDSRFDDLSRRLDFVHQALAARIDDRQGDSSAAKTPPTLEPLLRALAEKLETASAPQADSRALESLERQMAQVSERLERGDPQMATRLERAIEDLSAKLEQARAQDHQAAHQAAHEAARQAVREAVSNLPLPGRDEESAREIADLREKHEVSDLRSQQTLTAVHETLEKVVDRLAMLEDDVIETRAAQADLASTSYAAAPSFHDNSRYDNSRQEKPAAFALAAKSFQDKSFQEKPAAPASHFHSDDFLMEPGAGRPAERLADLALAQRMDDLEQDDEPDYDAPSHEVAHDDDSHAPAITMSRQDQEALQNKPAQANYIDVARRALAARAAAEAAEKVEAEERKRAKGPGPTDRAAAFVRPLAAGEKGGGRRLPALLAGGVALLLAGTYQAYRLFDTSPAPVQTAVQSHVEAAAPAPDAPVEEKAAAQAPLAPAAAPAVAQAPAVSATPAASSAAPAQNSAPILPGAMTPPKPVHGASMIDPLAVGAIGPRANSLSAVQASAQLAALREMANKGDAAAQFDMGARYAEGRGVDRDPAAAIGWFEKAAAQGQAQAQYRLGAIYEKGQGAARDSRKARDYYEKAATQGHVRAMHNLAVIEAEGVEGKPDYASAAQWFHRAADYGVRDSQFNLAILYARGMGVTQNLGQSFVWFDIAARQGDEDAGKKRDEIAGRLDAATMEAAKKQAADFHPRSPVGAINDTPALPTGPAAAAFLAPAPVKAAFSRI